MLFLALFVASMPGDGTRPVVFERIAPPVPDSVKDRDATLDVTVETPDHQPIRGARVRALAVLDDTVHLAGEGTTDAHGALRLAKLPRASHWILADAPGKARASTMIALGAGTQAAHLVLAPEHVLEVDVKDDRGAPLATAEVEITSGDPLPLGARAQKDGHVQVGRLASGPYVVTARAPGYEEITRHGVKEGEVALFTLRKMGSIVVHVVDAHDSPVEHADVQIAGAQLWPSRRATTDAEGEVKIAALPDGSYALRATKGAAVSATELDVPLHGGDAHALTLKLRVGMFVGVHVVEDGLDAPGVDGAAVTLAESGLTPFPLDAVTDKHGHVRLGPILPEGATVSVRAQDFVPADAIPVPDPLPGDMEVALVRAGALEGRVVDARGFPIDGATIEVVGTDFNGGPIDDSPRHRAFRAAQFTAALGGSATMIPMGELGVVPGPVPPIPHAGSSPRVLAGSTSPEAQPWVTRADGTFRIEPVSPGRVRLVVRHPQFVETTSDVVTLRSGKDAHVDVVMRQGGSLEGRVVDASGQPARGIRVTVDATKGSLERTTLSADDGSFAFASLPPEVSVSAASEDEPSAILVKVVLSIAEGAKQTITLTLPGARKPLALEVDDDRGYPIDAAQVTALSLDPSAPLRATAFTDARGETTLPNASDLRLRLEVTSPGHAPKVVIVDPAAPPTKIVLGRAESATGEVRSTHGDPIADADVAVYTQMGARRARTDAKGLFTLEGLAPGAAELRVRAKGYAPTKRTVTIAEEQSLRPTDLSPVELEDEAVVEGTVVDGRRDPVQGARVASGGVAVYVQAGVNPPGTAVSDRNGKFRLGELPAGPASIEAYAPDVGRGKAMVTLTSGRTNEVTITLGGQTSGTESNATGSVAVTLGVTDADEVVLLDVVEGSTAERGGLAPGDVLVTIDGQAVHALADARGRLNGPVADDVVLEIRRGGTVSTLRVEREAVRR